MKYIPKHLKKSHKAKKYILNSITAFMVILFWCSACAVDSESWIPIITLFVSMLWIMLFTLANGGKKRGFNK